MANLIYITEDKVRELLEWDSLVESVEHSIVSVSRKTVSQVPRLFMKIKKKEALLLAMPGYLEGKKDESDVLACKIVNVFQRNKSLETPLPVIVANIMLFDENTGLLKSVIEGNEITAWRTAAASVVGTKYLHQKRTGRKCDILAILGAGVQGRIHAIAFHHFFKFTKIHIWNIRPEKAKILAAELTSFGIKEVIAFTSKEECVQNADVIVTATFSSEPIVKLDSIKSNVHINAVGAGLNHHSELDPDIYRSAWICCDHWNGAMTELAGLKDMGATISAELGEVIIDPKKLPSDDRITIFHSLGMAVEDAAVAKLIFEKYCQVKKN